MRSLERPRISCLRGEVGLEEPPKDNGIEMGSTDGNEVLRTCCELLGPVYWKAWERTESRDLVEPDAELSELVRFEECRNSGAIGLRSQVADKSGVSWGDEVTEVRDSVDAGRPVAVIEGGGEGIGGGCGVAIGGGRAMPAATACATRSS